MTALKDIKGMTEGVAAKLKAQKIDNSDELLVAAKTPEARKDLAGAGHRCEARP